MEKIKSSLKFFIGLPLTIVSFIFIGKIVYDSRDSLLDSITMIDFAPFVIGIFFFLLFFLTKSLAWTQILKKRNHNFNNRELIYLYSLAEIRRFVPLFVMSYVSRVSNLSGKVSKKESFKSIGIEAALLTASSFTIALPGIFFVANRTFVWFESTLFLSIIFASLILMLLIRKTREIILSYFDVYLTLVLSWFLFGLASFFVAISLNYLNPINFLSIISLFTLSWLIGYIFFLSPMGLGVRELSATYLLSFFIPIHIATTIAVVTRVVMILSEIIYLGAITYLKRLESNSKIFKFDWQLWILGLLSLIYFTYFSFFSLLKHNSILTGRFDLGNMSQTVWNTANGKIFMLTNPDGTEIVSRLAVHSDFILLAFTPFYWIWPHPGVLLIGQSLILSVGGIFLYLIANHILKNKNLSLVLSASYYLNFWLHEQNLFDFHAVSLSTTFLLGTFYFLLVKRYKLFLFFLFLSVMTKENIFLIAGLFGLFIALVNKKYLWGTLLFVFSFIFFFFLSSYAIPEARGETHFALGSYKYLGSTTEEVALNIFLKPHIVFNQIFNLSTLEYFRTHLATTGYLALLTPFYLIFTLPEIAIYLLSSNFEYRSYQYHFGAAVLPFVYIASIYSIKFLSEKFKTNYTMKALTYYTLFASLLSFYSYSPVVGAKNSDLAILNQSENSKVLNYLDLIPDNAKVTASNNIAAHLSHRDYIFVVPLGFDKSDYVVFFKEKEEIINQFDKRNFELIINDNNIKIYKRIYPSS